jgi:CRP-like cAMP-binding protein
MSRREDTALFDAVAASPLMAACTPVEIRELIRYAAETHVPAGWTLLHEQTPSDACYLIVEGEATVRVHGEPVATLGRGDVVGEVGIAQSRLRNASVTASTPLHLLHIDASLFRDLSPGLRTAILRDVQQRTHSPETAPQ